MAEENNIPVTQPQIVGRQAHRANMEGNIPFQYYLRNLAIPLLDHIISELNSQFTGKIELVQL